MITNQRATAVVNQSVVEIGTFRTDESIQITINGSTCAFKTYYGRSIETGYEDTIAALKEAVNKL